MLDKKELELAFQARGRGGVLLQRPGGDAFQDRHAKNIDPCRQVIFNGVPFCQKFVL